MKLHELIFIPIPNPSLGEPSTPQRPRPALSLPVTPSELRLIREVVSAHKPGTQVLVLSTRLLRPTDVPELLFTTQRLVPDIGV
ncbi:unnamed protein product [Oncorhynchus mykiss]|uniref:Uncharacterized protein n=1 Tax=Oncorhynchus mykiss TaxID=8022 RepID=A0A060VU35_ONCMY|nr:unnamed protein product [Oncorhynchus mykiss]